MEKSPRAPESDIAGKRFGMLVAIKKSERRSDSGTDFLWRFRCDCGKEVDRIKSNIVRSTTTQSCGCLPDLHVSKNPDGPRLDIVGARYGALVAMGPVSKTDQGWNWAFLCDCGMATITRRKDVTSGNTASCGCLQGRKGAVKVDRPWSTA